MPNLKRLLLLLLVFSITSKGILAESNETRFEFDKGEGSVKSLQIGYTIIKLIQENKYSDLIQFYGVSSINSENLKEQIKEVSVSYPFNDSIFPVSYMTDSDKDFYYERNFCHYNGSKIIVDLQILVRMDVERDMLKISSIKILRGNQIVIRHFELKDIEKRTKDESLKPPPPPPPPLR